MVLTVCYFQWVTPNSGGLSLQGFADGPAGEPVTVFRLGKHQEWEVVVSLTLDGVVGMLTLQPAGTWHPEEQAAQPSGGITARLLRSLPIGEITSQAVALARRPFARVVEKFPDAAPHYHQWHEALQQRPGRRGRDDDFYLDFVVAYVELVDKGERAPVAAMASRRQFAATTIRNLIHEARRRGLLTPAPRGRSGGALTPKAVAMLKKRTEKAHGSH